MKEMTTKNAIIYPQTYSYQASKPHLYLYTKDIPIVLSKTYGTIPLGHLGQFGLKFLFLRLWNND